MALIELPKGFYRNIPANSFSSGDIMRIMASNLTKLERLHIIYFFAVVLPATGFMTDLIEIISLLFKPTRVLIKIFKIFRIWNMIVRRITPLDASLLLFALPEEPRRGAKRLLKVLEKDFFLEE